MDKERFRHQWRKTLRYWCRLLIVICLRKSVKTPLFAVLLTAFSSEAYSQSYACGGTQIDIKMIGVYEESRVNVTAKNKDHEASLWLHSVDYINGICLKNIKNKNKILINAQCGGSGCADHTYIVMDAETLMVELVPIEGKDNLSVAEHLLGKKIAE